MVKTEKRDLFYKQSYSQNAYICCPCEVLEYVSRTNQSYCTIHNVIEALTPTLRWIRTNVGMGVVMAILKVNMNQYLTSKLVRAAIDHDVD